MPNQPKTNFSSPALFPVALPFLWRRRREITSGGGLVRVGKQLLLGARDSGIVLLQQLQALFAIENLVLAGERIQLVLP